MASLPPSSAAVSSSICQSSSFSERRCGDYSISRLFRLSRNKTTHLLPCSSLKISANALPSSSPQRNGNRRRKPNAVVLDAQARVCTGPTQTRPLDEEKAFEVLRTIVQSAKGECEDKVSEAQLGAFFAAMTIRANSFPSKTQWSDGERKAMYHFWPSLLQVLPPEILFIADPEGTLMNLPSKGTNFTGKEPAEMRLVGVLKEVLHGGHLGFEEVAGLLRDILPIPDGSNNEAVFNQPSTALIAAFLIGQRMNLETDRELKAYCLAFDDELGEIPIVDVNSLTHYGEPYDGNTRFFRSTLFVAAVRASYGEACLIHGAEFMPPKMGVTEEQMLNHMGALTRLHPIAAAKLLENETVGFAYVSQREARPSLHSLVHIREHIKKRPPLATTEKVQRYVRATGKESMMAGFYHENYQDSLLMLMRRRGADAGLVIKGEEGALSLTTNDLGSTKGLPLNHCAGFRPSKTSNEDLNSDGVLRETFSFHVNPKDYGFQASPTPRVDRSVAKNVEIGVSALEGVKGAAYDRVVLNAAITDHLLGCDGASDLQIAIDRAKEAIDSGRALAHLNNYIKASHKVCIEVKQTIIDKPKIVDFS